MKNEQFVGLFLDKKAVNDVDRLAKERGFASRSSAIRTIFREYFDKNGADSSVTNRCIKLDSDKLYAIVPIEKPVSKEIIMNGLESQIAPHEIPKTNDDEDSDAEDWFSGVEA